jgi:hypothetical protein
MIGIVALGLGRSEHPQGYPIGFDGADEWTGDAFRDSMENGKWEEKKGD